MSRFRVQVNVNDVANTGTLICTSTLFDGDTAMFNQVSTYSNLDVATKNKIKEHAGRILKKAGAVQTDHGIVVYANDHDGLDKLGDLILDEVKQANKDIKNFYKALRP